jgi:hypothetical protein
MNLTAHTALQPVGIIERKADLTISSFTSTLLMVPLTLCEEKPLMMA